MTAALIGAGGGLVAALAALIYVAKLLSDARKDGKSTSEKHVAAERANADVRKERDTFIAEAAAYKEAVVRLEKEIAREKLLRVTVERHRTDLLVALSRTSDPGDLARLLNDELQALSRSEADTPPAGTNRDRVDPVR